MLDLARTQSPPPTLTELESLVGTEASLDGFDAEARRACDERRTASSAAEVRSEVGIDGGGSSVPVEAHQELLGGVDLSAQDLDVGTNVGGELGGHDHENKQTRALTARSDRGKIPTVIGRPRMPRTGREKAVMEWACRKMSLSDIARQLGVARHKPVDWKRGKSVPTAEELEKLEQLTATPARHGARRIPQK